MAHAQFRSVDDISSDFKIFMVIMSRLWAMDGAQLKELQRASGVTSQTLYNWRNGTVATPRIDTLSKVAYCMGYEIVFKRTSKGPLRSVK